MRRRLARPYGSNAPPTRMLSLLMALAVLAMLYQRAKEPQFWRWMTNESRAEDAEVSKEQTAKPAAVADPGVKPSHPENLVPGPNETDADELAKLRSNLKPVEDRQPLKPYDMPAYWQLMRWSRTRPFAELEKLARRDVPYSHLWEEPSLYRGQPLRLKLHVRRVLKYTAQENPLGLKTTYEIWGWTDDSRSFPFVVVVPEKPDGLPVGTDVEADVVFVGYFLKWMRYVAFDTNKNSPLLVGRIKPVTRITGAAKSGGWENAFLMLLGGVIAFGLFGWLSRNARQRPRSVSVAGNAVAPERLPDNWMSSAAVPDRAGSAPPVSEFVSDSTAKVVAPPAVTTPQEAPAVTPASLPPATGGT